MREEITEMYYPDKVSPEEFIRIITKEAQAFVDNMNNLKRIPNLLYPEQWMEIYAKWLDMRNFPRSLNEILGKEEESKDG